MTSALHKLKTSKKIKKNDKSKAAGSSMNSTWIYVHPPARKLIKLHMKQARKMILTWRMRWRTHQTQVNFGIFTKDRTQAQLLTYWVLLVVAMALTWFNGRLTLDLTDHVTRFLAAAFIKSKHREEMKNPENLRLAIFDTLPIIFGRWE